MDLNIDVQEIKKLDMPRGAVKGFADVRVDFGAGNGYITISGLGIVKPPNKSWFVSPPQRSYIDRSGDTKYQNIVGFFGQMRKIISEVVLAEWESQGNSLDEESIYDAMSPGPDSDKEASF